MRAPGNWEPLRRRRYGAAKSSPVAKHSASNDRENAAGDNTLPTSHGNNRRRSASLLLVLVGKPGLTTSYGKVAQIDLRASDSEILKEK
ncbi:hypothetical protein BaRGS_00014352 [Batillaria attramentaria]|uniref:Uncharacterized protein n=1 Tax=Batillaria attramentaria TaxID=370345 RepID=A0ABD0L541_9CAEN